MADQTRAKELVEKRKFWEKQIQNWQESNLTQSEYCRKNNLILHRFGYWKRRIVKSVAPQVSLVQVDMKANINSNPIYTSPLRLVFGNKFHIKIDRGFDPVTLRQLLCILT